LSRNNRFTQGRDRRGQARPTEEMFTCVHCHLYISCSPSVSGVQNRNHCPYCLWSRHLDWREPGDRMCSCRAPMEPVALTTRRGRNKYAGERDGELMLIHRCAGCTKLVLNRVAADDSAEVILAVFEASLAMGATLGAELALQGVSLLRRRLFGNVLRGEERVRRAS
jgi:RNHCP domain